MNSIFEALKNLGAGDFEHLNGSLIEHLKGTRDILINWKADSVLSKAGLYHAAYGTDGYSESMVSLSQRKSIASLIGEEAEQLVYLYCSCDRSYVFPKLGLTKDFKFRDRFSDNEFLLSEEDSQFFCELTVANEMELIYQSQSFKNKHGHDLFKLFNSMQKHLSPHATYAYRQELTFNDG